MENRLEAVERRLRRIEREMRAYRAAAALSVLLLAGAGWSAGRADASGRARIREPQAELRARRFALVAPTGEPLATLDAVSGGGPRFVLSGPGGAPRLSLELAADGAPSLTLNDASGRQRVMLEAGPEEARVSVLGLGRSAVTLANGGVAPRLAVADSEGRDRVWLAVRLGAPVLQFLDAKGFAHAGLTTFNDDIGLAAISGTDRSQPGLVLLGKDRSVVWSAP
jgi:hypothetical protein